MAHVAIVGAGIIGAALAGTLVRRGASVTVLDSGLPGAGTSGSSLAWLNANKKVPRHYHDLNVRGMAEWRELASGLGDPSWYVPTGSLRWGAPGTLAPRLKRLRAWGYPVEELTVRAAAALEPALRIPDDAAVAYFPAEAFLHGGPVVEALLADGPQVVKTGDDVRFEVRDTRVVAARWPGGRLAADVFVSCAGWRTPQLLGPVGVPIPLTAGDEPGSPAPCLVLRTSGPAPITRVVNAPTLSLRPLLRRGIQLEGTDVDDRVDTGTPPATLDRLAAGLLARTGELLTGFDAGETAHRVCVRPLPVDGHPVVGWAPGLANTYVIVTHSGMTLAAVLARLAATEILTGRPDDDLQPYRPGRFPA